MGRILSILAGIIVIVIPFLPFASMLGISVTMMQFEEDRKSVCYVVMALGAVIALVGLANKRMLYILNILLGLITAGFGALLFSGAKEKGMDPGIGIYLFIVAGVVALIGAIMGVAKKKANSAVA